MTAVDASVVEVVKVGNLTKDPMLRYGQNGQAIVEVDLAVNPPKSDAEGETQFYKLVLFRSLAENASETLEKSMRVVVVGRPDVDKWTDQETQEERSRKKIIVSAIGPDLRYAVAEVKKVYRTPNNNSAGIDPTNF